MLSFAALPALVALLVPSALAQSSGGSSVGTAIPPSASSLPGCALQCTLSSLPGTPCAQFGVSNITCICTDSQFQLAFYQCQSETCSPENLQQALAYGAQTCQQNGTPINTAVTPSGFSSGAASATGSGSGSSAAGSASRSASSGMMSSSSAASSAATGPAGSAASGSAPAAASSAPASGANKIQFNSPLVALGLTLAAVAGGVGLMM